MPEKFVFIRVDSWLIFLRGLVATKNQSFARGSGATKCASWSKAKFLGRRLKTQNLELKIARIVRLEQFARGGTSIMVQNVSIFANFCHFLLIFVNFCKLL